MNSFNGGKAAVTSIIAAMTGQITSDVSGIFHIASLEIINTAFQHTAWSVAIIAGLVSIVNGTRRWFKKR